MTSTKNIETTSILSLIDNPAQDVADIINNSRDEHGVVDETKLMVGLVIYISNRDGKIMDHVINIARGQNDQK